MTEVIPLSRLAKTMLALPDDRAAGELERARPASSWINRRPESLAFQGFPDNSILLDAKCSAAEAQSKKSNKDFLDKLKRGMTEVIPLSHFQSFQISGQ